MSTDVFRSVFLMSMGLFIGVALGPNRNGKVMAAVVVFGLISATSLAMWRRGRL